MVPITLAGIASSDNIEHTYCEAHLDVYRINLGLSIVEMIILTEFL